MRLVAAAFAAVFLVAGCSLGAREAATGKPPYTAPPPTPTLGPASGPPDAEHGTPYSADDLRQAVSAAGSRLPPVLGTDPLATAIAETLAGRISTYDGQPYRELTLSGSCDDDARRCDLQVKGVPAFAVSRDTADLYTFSVDVATGVLAPAGDPALRGFPAALVPELDAAVRSQLADRLAETSLLAAQWAPGPPGDDGYVLWYGTGDEEADQQIMVRYDRTSNTAQIVGE